MGSTFSLLISSYADIKVFMFEVSFWFVLTDTVWFIRIKEPGIAETSEDDCEHAVVAGQRYIIGDFLERSRSNSQGYYFKVDIKTSYFYHESIGYPFAQFTEKKNEFLIENSEYLEIIHFIGHTGMASLSSLWFCLYYSSVHYFCWYS